jgi:hypothetical protein
VKRLASLGLTLAVFATLAAGCGGLDEFDITRSTEATVPAGPPSGGGTLSGFGALDVGSAESLQREGIDPSDVDSAELRRLEVQVLSGSSLETFVEAVEIRIQSPGLPERVVASKSGIRALPADTRVVALDVTPGVDLKPYLTATSATLSVGATGSGPAEETRLRVTATVRVDVNVSGLFD